MSEQKTNLLKIVNDWWKILVVVAGALITYGSFQSLPARVQKIEDKNIYQDQQISEVKADIRVYVAEQKQININIIEGFKRVERAIQKGR